MEIIRLKEISKIYKNKKVENKVLYDVNLSIKQGDFVAIVGTSGSGKSTLLNILGLLDVQTNGEYHLDGKNTDQLNEKEFAKLRNTTFGFVVQHFALIKDLTVYDNIEIPLEYGNVKKGIRKAKIIEILKKLKIEEKMNSKVNELSGGQCQRVAIARALVNNPKIILADEPTGALDKQTGLEVMDILKKLNKEGKTILLVTHDEAIANRCDKIIRIEDGKILTEIFR
ncbi:ABC transporter ATP-binding protein [uncultured Clostridium sp.]|jgi:putative ABC transport system ATP-binding protein|uniref:ABC transporter ATP-binding protein n=1 Tax=uncultured Clostridium sp. TaxID=59620 RepID=UPI00260DE749|nr:ABC transporter ATP-binding protein [uncultured Clostridium sp.]